MSLSPFAWRRANSGLAGCGLAAWMALAGCDGSATQTTTGKAVEGILVDSQGNPVNGATVRAWPAVLGPTRGGNAQDTSKAYSARTDAQGRYSLSGMEVGVYNLFGANPSNHATVLIPRVKSLEQAADLGVDTLKAPGAIIGTVRAEGGNAPLTFCYLEGSDYAAISDATGRFLLPDLAEGVYRLNYFAEGYLRASDSVVIVRSGDTTTLPAKTLAPDLALQPPGPHILSAVYDSVYGVVHLAWNSVHVADLKEYWVEHRDSPDISPDFLDFWITEDTTSDDMMMLYFGKYGLHSGPFTRTYWLRSRDIEGNLSPKPSDSISVRISYPAILRTRFSMEAVADTANRNPCRDTVALALDVVSSPDSLVRIQWSAGGYFRIFQSDDDLKTRAGVIDTLAVSIGAPHRDTLYVTHQVLDSLSHLYSQVAFDSVYVSANLFNNGNLIRSVTVPVGVDSLGCFHPYPATEEPSPWDPDSTAPR